MQALYRTSVYASAAADALRRMRYLFERKPRRTSALAGMAGNAPLLLPVNLHQAEPVKPSVYCPQGTQILAERPVNLHGKNHQHKQNPKLPKEQPSCLAAQKLISRKQGQGSKERPRRAEIFAEGRNLCKAPKEKHRADDHQKNQDKIFSIFQHGMKGQALPLLKQGNPMKQILYQSKGTEPAAHEAPQNASKYKEKSQNPKGNLYIPLIQHCLERPDGTGAESPRAGIAV